MKKAVIISSAVVAAIPSEFHKGDISSRSDAVSSLLSVLWNFDQVAKKEAFLA